RRRSPRRRTATGPWRRMGGHRPQRSPRRTVHPGARTMKRSSLDRRSERGSVSVEVAVIAPAFVFLMLLVVFAGKVSEADGNVERAAAEGARAASLRQHPGNAATDARSTVEANLATAGVSCSTLEAIVDTSDFE